ncbi:hypothetical protein [Pedobacter sp.]|uniref:hypothetical protein n=1 Tax=Pedobacter sp. TaxID=1411316 RepID=UPI003D7FE890
MLKNKKSSNHFISINIYFTNIFSNFVAMETDKFNFGYALVFALNAWVRGNGHLSSAIENPSRFLGYDDKLIIDLTTLDEPYQVKFIETSLKEYTDKMLVALEKPIGDFLLTNNFPPVILDIQFIYAGTMVKSVKYYPSTTILNAVKR